MLKPTYLLDSVILIDHLMGIAKATKWLSTLNTEEGVISVISQAEVLVGTTEEDESPIQLFLNQFPCLPIFEKTGNLAAKLRKKEGWKLPDAFQAAIAIEHNIKLVTRNTKDFSKKKHPFVFIPYQL